MQARSETNRIRADRSRSLRRNVPATAATALPCIEMLCGAVPSESATAQRLLGVRAIDAMGGWVYTFLGSKDGQHEHAFDDGLPCHCTGDQIRTHGRLT